MVDTAAEPSPESTFTPRCRFAVPAAGQPWRWAYHRCAHRVCLLRVCCVCGEAEQGFMHCMTPSFRKGLCDGCLSAVGGAGGADAAPLAAGRNRALCLSLTLPYLTFAAAVTGSVMTRMQHGCTASSRCGGT